MAEIKITNIVKLYTMLLLYSRPMHGYELIHRISDKIAARVSTGQIYPFLKKMQKNRLIEIKESGKREKKVYALTREGRKFARKMIERFGSLIDLAIEPKLTVCAHCGCKVYSGGYKEKIKGKQLNFCCRYCANSFKK